jgi:hypothetical protein
MLSSLNQAFLWLLLHGAAICCLPLQHVAAATLFEVDPWVIPPNNVSESPASHSVPRQPDPRRVERRRA